MTGTAIVSHFFRWHFEVTNHRAHGAHLDVFALILLVMGLIPLVLIILAFRGDGKTQKQRVERRVNNFREIWPDKSEEEIRRMANNIERGRNADGNYGSGPFRNYGGDKDP